MNVLLSIQKPMTSIIKNSILPGFTASILEPVVQRITLWAGLTASTLEPVQVRPGSTDRDVYKYIEGSTGLGKPEMAKRLAVSDAPHLSRLAGVGVVR